MLARICVAYVHFPTRLPHKHGSLARVGRDSAMMMVRQSKASRFDDSPISNLQGCSLPWDSYLEVENRIESDRNVSLHIFDVSNLSNPSPCRWFTLLSFTAMDRFSFAPHLHCSLSMQSDQRGRKREGAGGGSAIVSLITQRNERRTGVADQQLASHFGLRTSRRSGLMSLGLGIATI